MRIVTIRRFWDSILRVLGIGVSAPLGRIASVRGSTRDTIIRTLYTTARWQPPIEDVLEVAIQDRQQPIFLDVGANYGHFSVLAAHFGASVISIEAVESLCNQMIQIRDKWNLPIDVLCASIGDRGQRLVRLDGPESNMGGTRTRHLGVDELSQFPSSVGESLNDLIPQKQRARIALIKIDIEGHEWFALKDILEWVQGGIAHNPTVIFEYTPEFSYELGHDYQEILEGFFQVGYSALELPPAVYDGGDAYGTTWSGLRELRTLPARRADIVLYDCRVNSKLHMFLTDALDAVE